MAVILVQAFDFFFQRSWRMIDIFISQPLLQYMFECSTTMKIGVEGVSQERGLVMFAVYITLAGINILFSCTPYIFTSETKVHQDRAR